MPDEWCDIHNIYESRPCSVRESLAEVERLQEALEKQTELTKSWQLVAKMAQSRADSLSKEIAAPPEKPEERK